VAPWWPAGILVLAGMLLGALLAHLAARRRGAAKAAPGPEPALEAAHALAEVAREIAGPLGLPEVADRIVTVVQRAFRARRAALFELDAMSGELRCLAAAGRVDREKMVGHVLGTGAGVIGRAVTENRPVWLSDVSADDPALRYPEWARRALGTEAHSSMAVALTVKGETIGGLGFAAEPGRQESADDLALLTALADQAAIALQNARLYREQAMRARRLSVLSRLNQIVSSSLDAGPTLDAINRAASELMEAPYAAIWAVDEARRVLDRRVATTNSYPAERQRFGEGLTAWAAEHRCIVNVDDGAADTRTLHPDWFAVVGVRSFLAVPILHEDSLLGVIALARQRPFRLDVSTRELLDAFVAQSAIAIRNVQLYEEAERRRRQAETGAALARTIGATLDVDALLQRVVESTRDLLGCDHAVIALRDPEADVMRMRYGAPHHLSRSYEAFMVERGKGLGGLAWKNLRPERTANYLEDPRLGRDYEGAVSALGLVAILVVPILIDDGVEGLLYVNNLSERPFTGHDEAVLSDLALHAAIAIQNARLFERVRTANDRLAALSRRLLEVQEAERRKLARELHDEIGQVLTGLTLILERSKRLGGDAWLACVSEAQALAGDLLSRVRDLSLDLRPAMLDDLGLLPALLWHFERYTTATGVKVAFSQRGLENRRLPPEIETAAFRIVQEALTNVARHSGAYDASVVIALADGVLRLEVSDAGAGFDPDSALQDGRSSGLIGARERARLSNGRLTLTSAPGGGARLSAELPADPAA
jgi:signal transduction histidine kinase